MCIAVSMRFTRSVHAKDDQVSLQLVRFFDNCAGYRLPDGFGTHMCDANFA